MNSTSTPAAVPASRRPATKHLTIDPDHSVPQLKGSAPPNALGALAMPQLLWHRTVELCTQQQLRRGCTVPPMRARYVWLVRFSFLILIDWFVTLEP
jgi:hypothetical protein